MDHNYDLIVAGGGNAGLVAALTALEKGKRVLLLKKAPQEDRGGNSKYTRDFRVAHRNGQFGLDGEYSYDEFMEDLIKVTKDQTDKRLARIVVENLGQAVKWANEHGVKWQRSLPLALHLGRTNLFILGGGKALLNTYYEKLKNKHGTVMYGSEVNAVEVEGNEFRSVIVNQGNEKLKFRASELVLSSGGFESNLELLKKFWGVRADNMIIRGTHNNTGLPMISMIENGAETIGKGDDGHVVAVDARSPKFNGGIVTRVDSIPFSITVNREGERFYDEGEDLWPKRYAIWESSLRVNRDTWHTAFLTKRSGENLYLHLNLQ
jgi:tricarballylate dehydrogenase